MKELSLIFYILYGSSALLIIIGTFRSFIREGKYIRNESKDELLELNDITVIIPFRNEQDRIKALIESINVSKEQPNHFIFVDDHSSDLTTQIIESQLKITNFTIVSVDLEGKKQAIKRGVNEASTKFILTLDADVIFSKTYFSKFKRLGRRDMIILPVIMQGKGWKRIFEMDVDLSAVLNCSTAGLGNPILASGANLLFSKEAYLNYSNVEVHSHIASGDDVFLLNNFKKNECSIQLITDPSLSVKTEVPLNLTEYFQQRLRWIKKTGSVKDLKSTLIATIQFCWMVLFWSIIILAINQNEYEIIFQLLLIKVIVDIVASMMYLTRIEKGKKYFSFFIYQFWLPIVSIALLIGIFLIKPTWKERRIWSR